MHFLPRFKSQQPRSKKRWLRFRLRTLLVVLTMTCMWLGWLVHGVQQQRRAAAKAEKFNAYIVYHSFAMVPPWTDIVPPRMCGRIESLLPSNDWRRLTRVSIQTPEFKDEHISMFRGLPHLTHVCLPATGLTNAGLKQLADLHLRSLTVLDLSGTKITDAGLAHIRNMSRLEILLLSGNEIAGAGLKHLSGLTNLKWLSLEDTHVTDAAIKQLPSLPKLEELHLDRTDVTGACLTNLSAIQSLRMLDLGGTKVCGQELSNLARFRKLEVVILNDTPVSDSDVKYLQNARQIVALWINGTAISDEFVRKLPNAKQRFRRL